MNQRAYFQYDDLTIELEDQERWGDAIAHLLENWKSSPQVDTLISLCAEIWAILVFCEQLPNTNSLSKDDLRALLMSVTRVGFRDYSNNGKFMATLGYCINLMPYQFDDFGGDYTGWEKKGADMVATAYEIDPADPVIESLYFGTRNLFDSWDEQEAQHRRSCAKIWARYTKEEWGESLVQTYFRSIFYGIHY